jgi:hypothetical protein
MERNIRRKQYGSTEAMLADCKWILHNCIIFNSPSSKLTTIAKGLVKVCTDSRPSLPFTRLYPGLQA